MFKGNTVLQVGTEPKTSRFGVRCSITTYTTSLSLSLNLNGLLVIRQIDNISPGGGGGGVRQEEN